MFKTKNVNTLKEVLSIFNDEYLITDAIQEYCMKYGKGVDNLMLPGENDCSVGRKYVYIKSGEKLLAIYDYRKKQFIELTPQLIKRYSV